MEMVLTFGLVSVILGTASGAQNLGIIGALGVGSYIALAGLWGSPISGASMNPARTFGPDLVGADFTPTGCTWPARSPGGHRGRRGVRLPRSWRRPVGSGRHRARSTKKSRIPTKPEPIRSTWRHQCSERQPVVALLGGVVAAAIETPEVCPR